MIKHVYEKLAKIAVEYSLEIEKGHTVYISGPSFAMELFQALNMEIIKAGAHPLIVPGIEGIRETFFKWASDEQLVYVGKAEELIFTEFDRLIEIQADYNTRKYSNIGPKRLSIFMGTAKRAELRKIQEQRTSSGELKWVVIPYPCNAYAQEANMDLFSYSDFVNKSLFLDKENPIEEWQNMQKKQDLIIEKLNKLKQIQVIGEDTDLSLSVEGRKWINCCGKSNLPDGEIYTGPVEDSINGHIRFTYPGIYMGKEVEDIYLEFDDGEVIKATAAKGEDILQEILTVENADRIGEFAIGTNYGVSKFTKNMLFDEKIGGTLHCALGLGFELSGSKNVSSVHWDILKDMKVPGSKIIADDKIIYEEGKWKI
ncbi:MAG: aminopeptidase [Promethearchaeota archaeon Loki_b32]|nr:MAG: aminopeptidase [Candidatus Lokiarchaeota archaeon Loki_b32]